MSLSETFKSSIRCPKFTVPQLSKPLLLHILHHSPHIWRFMTLTHIYHSYTSQCCIHFQISLASISTSHYHKLATGLFLTWLLTCHTLPVLPMLSFVMIYFTVNLSLLFAWITFPFVFGSSTIFSLHTVTTTKWKSKNLWIFYHTCHGCPFLLGIRVPQASLIVMIGLELGKI
jgi:hypothetical protein